MRMSKPSTRGAGLSTPQISETPRWRSDPAQGWNSRCTLPCCRCIVRLPGNFMGGFGYLFLLHYLPPFVVALSESISADISADFHAVVRGPSFTGAGALPSRTHCHQVLLPIGISAGIGGLASGSPMICVIRRNAALDCVVWFCMSY